MPNPTANRFKVGEWTVDPQMDEIANAGRVIKLEPRMMRLLVRLAESPGQVLSTPQLLDSVWSGVIVGPASVYQAVSALRKLLGDTDPTPTYIATVTRKGYRLIAPVSFKSPVPTGAADGAAESTAPLARPRAPRPRVWRWLIALPALAVVGLTAWYFVRPPAAAPSSQMPTAARDRLAALPRIVVPNFLATEEGDGAAIFATAISDLVRIRLLTQPGVILLQNIRSYGLMTHGRDFLEASRQCGAQFVLKGTGGRNADKLHIEVELVKIADGASLWTLVFDRRATDVTAIREQILVRLAESLKFRLSDTGNKKIDLDEHVLFNHAQFMRFNVDLKDHLPLAQAMFLRATVLYPRCARCYLGLGQSLMEQRLPGESYQHRVDEAAKALDRALELDPDSSEALYIRASLEKDEARAEALFRRSLALAPNDEWAYLLYGRFLESVKRIGEAIDVYERGLQIDPVSEAPLGNMARVMVFTRGDVAGFERIQRRMMEDCPSCGPTTWLARTRLVFGGASAEAVKILEQLAAVSTDDFDAKPLLAAAYLEVDDPEAAAAVDGDNQMVQVQIAQYRHLRPHAGRLSDGDLRISFPAGPGAGFNGVAEALRDEALETHQYAKALSSLDVIYRAFTFPPPSGCKIQLLSAHVLMMSGDRKKAEAEARSILTTLDNEAIGRPPHWFARDRASAYMLLGDHEHAIAELQESQKNNSFVRWWYTGELDPLFVPLHSDPRFQVLVAAARRHRVEQRALVDEMRRKGDIPLRAPVVTARH